jgi:hypothetical protein
MMRRNKHLAAALLLAATLVLAGCNNNGNVTTIPPATPAPPFTNVAGQYHGTVHDSVLGKGAALGDFSQTRSSVGGRLEFTFGSHTAVNSVAMVLSRSNALKGTGIATIGSAACTFAIAGSYDATNFNLSGSYSATNGCSGQTGTFTMTEACFYHQGIRSPQGAARRRTARERPDSGLRPC